MGRVNPKFYINPGIINPLNSASVAWRGQNWCVSHAGDDPVPNGADAHADQRPKAPFAARLRNFLIGIDGLLWYLGLFCPRLANHCQCSAGADAYTQPAADAALFLQGD
jgi:hypothetical protein